MYTKDYCYFTAQNILYHCWIHYILLQKSKDESMDERALKTSKEAQAMSAFVISFRCS